MVQTPPTDRSWLRRTRTALLGVPLAFLGAFALGPRVHLEDRWVEPALPVDLDAYLAADERGVRALREGDAKGIVWSDPEMPSVTPLSIVYLHGFSADRHEVEPLVSELANDLGANVFFTRLAGHGQDGAAMGEATAEEWLDDTAEAIAIGGRIGERVVLMGTSTGGTLALWAAARPEAKERIAGLVLISPNVGVQDPAAPILLWPWGGLIGRMVVGPERCFEPHSPEEARHWTTCYPPSALVQMMAVVRRARTLDDASIDAPTLVIYSKGDEVVDPEQTEAVIPRVTASPPTMYVVEGAEDRAQHVIAGAIMSPGATERVRARIRDFLAATLG
jgi:alpha-beta hydrolase superfamily lysophospholipase